MDFILDIQQQTTIIYKNILFPLHDIKDSNVLQKCHVIQAKSLKEPTER